MDDDESFALPHLLQSGKDIFLIEVRLQHPAVLVTEDTPDNLTLLVHFKRRLEPRRFAERVVSQVK